MLMPSIQPTLAKTMACQSFDASDSRDDHMPPFEMAKVWAFHKVIQQISEHTGLDAFELLGRRSDDFIASEVHLANGKHPTPRSIRKAIQRRKDPSWYPGKVQAKSPGRPPVYSAHVKGEIARVAMELKRKLVAPTPRRVRARLPLLTRNPDSGEPMDKKTFHGVFKTQCYDITEDDPWQYLEDKSQDMLASALKPLRVRCAQHILDTNIANNWFNHVAIDPCYSLLPKHLERLEEQRVAAMGRRKWKSPGASRDGSNLRAPATAKTQGGSWVTRVDWTVVFARGKVRIFVCDPEEAKRNANYPAALCDATNLGKFVRHVLPKVLDEMKAEHGWSNIPRTVVHDKASYMVTRSHHRLNAIFAGALAEAGFTSWIGDNHGTTEWLVKKWGDVYLHETVISHVRRLLDNEFPCARLHETPAQFQLRVRKVQAFMNSPNFAATDGGRGLAGLAKDLKMRCKEVLDRSGERIPH